MSDLPPGFVIDEAKAVALPPGFVVDPISTAKDVAKSAGIGVAKGSISMLGGAGDLRNLLSRGVEAAGEKLGFDSEKVKDVAGKAAGLTGVGTVLKNAPSSADITGKIEEKTGQFYKPQTTAGKYAETAGEFLPAAAFGPGRALPKLASGVLAGFGSEGAGQLTEGSKAEPYARVAGAMMGGLTPMAAGRAVTPLPASAAKQRLVDVLADEGVTSLTAGQRTGNKALQYAEDMLGNSPGAGQSATNIRQRGQEQFTEAAMRRAGAGLDATPEVLAANNTRLGNQFEQLSSRNNLTPDNQMIADITDAVRHYRRVPNSQQAQMLQGYIDDIIPHINAGVMPGVEYQPMRSMLSTDSKAVRQTDPYLSRALGGLRDALDNAMSRSISPADREAWQTARREYGAQKTIEKTASRAGEATAEGQLVPANLRNTVSADNRGAYARGEGQFAELARAGVGAMTPLPNSGTAQRLNLTNVAMLPVSATIGRALMTRPVQGYLGNQALADAVRELPPARQAVVMALLEQQNAGRIEGPR